MAKPISVARPEIVRSPPSGTFTRVAPQRVVLYPDPRLRRPSLHVDPCDPTVVALAHALTATMRAAAACVGLAAPQIGHAARLFCMDVTGHKRARSCAGLVVLANPRIVAQSEESTSREGCLSLPHLTGNVARPREVTVEGMVPGTGELRRVSANAIEARCLLHELDHLDGLVFVNRVHDPQRNLFPRKSYA